MRSPSRPAGYIPAAGHRWLTPLYDPGQRWLMRERTIKERLVAQAVVERGQRVLDLGCGTGTLALLIQQQCPGAQVVGLDIDPDVLTRARAKSARAGAPVALTRGAAFDLPFRDGVFDRVVSSLLLHHLTTADKRRALREAYRVLRPGGQLHVADFGRPHTAYSVAVSLLMRHFEEVALHVAGALPAMLRTVGFASVDESSRYTTIFGTVALYRACRPPDPPAAAPSSETARPADA